MKNINKSGKDIMEILNAEDRIKYQKYLSEIRKLK